jgi:hypothetical protein
MQLSLTFPKDALDFALSQIMHYARRRAGVLVTHTRSGNLADALLVVGFAPRACTAARERSSTVRLCVFVGIRKRLGSLTSLSDLADVAKVAESTKSGN